MDASTVEHHLKNIDRDGFTVIENAIDPGFVVSLRDTIRRIEAKEPNLVQGSILRTVGLLGLDPIFRRPPLHEEVLPVVEAALGPGCLLTLYDSLDVTPGKNLQPLHNDDALMPLARPHQTLVLTAMWALSDFTEETGATRVVPGSHREPGLPDYSKYQGDYQTQCVKMRTGSVLLLDGAVWHTSGENRTPGVWRLGMQVSYCAGFIRPLQNLMLSIPPDEAREYSDELLALCGYATFNGIGQVIRHGAQDVETRSPARHALGRAPLPDRGSGRLREEGVLAPSP